MYFAVEDQEKREETARESPIPESGEAISYTPDSLEGAFDGDDSLNAAFEGDDSSQGISQSSPVFMDAVPLITRDLLKASSTHSAEVDVHLLHSSDASVNLAESSDVGIHTVDDSDAAIVLIKREDTYTPAIIPHLTIDVSSGDDFDIPTTSKVQKVFISIHKTHLILKLIAPDCFNMYKIQFL